MLTIKEIAKKYNIDEPRLYIVIKLFGVPERGKAVKEPNKQGKAASLYAESDIEKVFQAIEKVKAELAKD